MSKTYVGFYWTLPVPWAGFTTLPKDVDQAAAASLTIRYQRDLTKRWVEDQRGELIDEKAVLETEPDRGSAEVAQEAVKLLHEARARGAVLLWVDFTGDGGSWRAHGWLRHALREALAGDPEGAQALAPGRISMEGRPQVFDPQEHFANWRAAQKRQTASKPEHRALILSHLEGIAGAPLAAQAEALVEADLKTFTGKPWTEENLRKFLKAGGLAKTPP